MHFYNCGKISSFTIPYGLKELGKNAFLSMHRGNITIENPNFAKDNLTNTGITYVTGYDNSTAREYYVKSVMPTLDDGIKESRWGFPLMEQQKQMARPIQNLSRSW